VFGNSLCGQAFPDTADASYAFSGWLGRELQGNPGVDLIFLILRDTEIPHRDIPGRMVEDAHQQGGLRTLLPGVITEGLAQRMAAYVIHLKLLRGAPDDAVSLETGKGRVLLLRAGEKVGAPAVLVHLSVVFLQLLAQLAVQQNTVFFAGFLLPHHDMALHFPVCKYVVPRQAQDVADTQGGVQAQQHQGVVAQGGGMSFLLLLLVKVFELSQFILVTYRLCRAHVFFLLE